MRKRAMGALEAEVLAALSVAEQPLSPGELLVALGDDVSYSTVTTILTRLVRKGQVGRSRDGRRFTYELTVDEADVVAEQMFERLSRSGDRVGVLRRFVSALGPEEAEELRDLLDGLDDR